MLSGNYFVVINVLVLFVVFSSAEPTNRVSYCHSTSSVCRPFVRMKYVYNTFINESVFFMRIYRRISSVFIQKRKAPRRWYPLSCPWCPPMSCYAIPCTLDAPYWYMCLYGRFMHCYLFIYLIWNTFWNNVEIRNWPLRILTFNVVSKTISQSEDLSSVLVLLPLESLDH